MILIPFLEATAEYQRLKAFRQGEIAMASLEKSMAADMARFFRHQGNILLQYLPEEFDVDDFSRAWDRTQLETYLEFRDLLLKHKRRAAYTCLRALENELSIPMQEAAKPRTISTKISFDDFDEDAYKHIEQYAGARISQIDDSTKKDIREIIAKGFKGEVQPDGTTKYKTHQQIAKEIKDKFEDFGAPVKGPSHIRNRAHLVAVTELREAGETSKQLARDKMEAKGWQMLKRWMNMGDARVSDGCIENGSAGWIDSKEAFPSGHQFPPRFPGCRCGTGSRVGDRKERSGLPDDRWIVTRQGDKVIVKPNPKYKDGYDKPLPDKPVITPVGQLSKDTRESAASEVIRLCSADESKYPAYSNGEPLMAYKGRKAKDIGKWDILEDNDLVDDVVISFKNVIKDVKEDFDKLGVPLIRGQKYGKSLKAKADMGDGIIGLNKLELKFDSAMWNDKIEDASNWKRGDDIINRPITSSGFFETGKEKSMASWYHEFGHQIHQQYNVKTGRDYRYPPLEGELKQTIKHKWRTEAPTKYAGGECGVVNIQEWFAENYALMKMNRSDLCDPESFKLFKRLGLL